MGHGAMYFLRGTTDNWDVQPKLRNTALHRVPQLWSWNLSTSATPDSAFHLPAHINDVFKCHLNFYAQSGVLEGFLGYPLI